MFNADSEGLRTVDGLVGDDLRGKPFVHLHAHYSFGDGICDILPLVRRAAELGMPAVAMTDRGVLHGAVDFCKACRSVGLKPLVGCEISVLADERRAPCRDPEKCNQLVLLAKDNDGYRNLARISTLVNLERADGWGRIDKMMLRNRSKGLVGLALCQRGEIGTHLREGRIGPAEATLREYAEFFEPGDFYLTMQDHGVPVQRILNGRVRELCRRIGVKAVITNDVRYLMRDHAEAYEMMRSIRAQTMAGGVCRRHDASGECHFKSREELAALFPSAADALDASLEIAGKCDLRLARPAGKVEVLDETAGVTPEGMDALAQLRNLGRAGLERRYALDCNDPKSEEHRQLIERFDYEVEIVAGAGCADGFLVAADIARWARGNDIPVGPGRGHIAGSLLAYSLEITQVDPVRFGLVFERFISPGRVSPPVLRIDTCADRRESVIGYVRRKYSEERCARIVTYGRLGARKVIRDIAGVLEIPPEKTNAWIRLIPGDPEITLQKARKESPAFDAACQRDPDLNRIMRYAVILEGLCRNTGAHAAGVVIGSRPLIDLVPLARDNDGALVTQYDNRALGEVGLVKLEVLGLRTLTVLKAATDLVKRTHAIDTDLDAIPLDDPKTYELLQRADTSGVFQLESAAMRRILQDLGPSCIEELVAVLALCGPGSVDTISTLIRRKKSVEAFGYDPPMIKPVLEETYGVAVYQEQLLSMIQVLAGLSLCRAGVLLRDMGLKTGEGRDRALFIDGFKSHTGLGADKAGELFDRIGKAAGRGVSKAHAVACGLLTYRTAYMKAHYPSEFGKALELAEG